MKLVPVSLDSREIGKIREGEMFQVGTPNHGVFKGPAQRDECGILYFRTKTCGRITISQIDSLFKIDPLKKPS